MIKIKSLLSHPFLSGSALLVSFGMASNVLGYLYHLVMGKILSLSEYGELASIYSILYLVSIVPVSSSIAIVKFISGSKSLRERVGIYREINKFLIFTGLILGVVLVASSSIIGNFLHIDDLIGIFLLGPTLFLLLITLINQSSLQGIMKFIGASLPNFAATLFKLVIGVILVVLGLSVRGAMVGVLAGAFIAYILSVKLIGKHFESDRVKKFRLRKFFKYATPVLFQSIAFTSLFTTDILLVKHFFSPFEAGLYAALSTLGKIVFFAASPITSAMFPFVSARKSLGEKYFRILVSSLAMTILISFGVVAIYFLFPDLAIGILYREEYLVAKGELVWMGLFIAFYTVSYLLINFFLAVDRVLIVILPIIASVTQIILIWNFHSTLLQVIQISLLLVVVQFILLSIYLGYTRLYAKSI